MTKMQREDFEAAMQDIKRCMHEDYVVSASGGLGLCPAEPPAAASVHLALSILSSRFDEIERRLDLINRTAQRADIRTRAVGGRP